MLADAVMILKELSEAVGPPALEDEVRELVRKHLEPYAKSIDVDRLGNLYARLEGDGPTIMLAAHMDEVALMITHIDKRGFLRFHTLGGIAPHVLHGQRVVVITRDGRKLPGYIGFKAPHLLKPQEREKVVPIEEMYIDIGAESEEEARDMGVEEGCFAVFDTKFTQLTKHRVMGKAFDDRAGLTAMILAFRELSEHDVNLVAVATVQEEVGLRGARPAAWIVEPEIALAIECTAAADTPGVPEHRMSTRLGRGPAITVADRSIVVSPRVVRMLIEAARRAGVKYQFKEVPVGGTDAGVIHLVKRGALAGVVSVPGRYIHSPAAVIDLRDLEATVRLVVEFVKLAKERL